MIHHHTGVEPCIDAFIPAEEIRMKAKEITTVIDEYTITERLFQDIKFNCDGYITDVIIGTKDLSSTSNPPEIHLWKRNDTGYEISNQTISLPYESAVSDMFTPFLRWYNLSPPVSVQKDDILGIYNYIPTSGADCHIYYQRFSGPMNFYPNLSETGDNHYPLVSVIYCECFKLQIYNYI